MDPATLAALAVAVLVRLMAAETPGGAETAREPDAADRCMELLYLRVRSQFRDDPRNERTLRDAAAEPSDVRRQGRLELALESAMEKDHAFAGELEALLDDLARRPPWATAIRDTGSVAGRDIAISLPAGDSPATDPGRDLEGDEHEEQDDH